MASAVFSQRSDCRACGKASLRPILSLGDQYVSNFVDPGVSDLPRAPLDLVLCDVTSGGCGLLQLHHTVSPEILYRHYWYRSVVNSSMREALADITAAASRLISLSPGDVVLDIGCNDGTLLRSYARDDLQLVGFEPAQNMIAEAKVGTTAIVNDFFSGSAFIDAFGAETKARIVTSIAMFYDLEEPNEFVADVAEIMADDGVWIIQMSYLPSMLEQNAFDNICHEHLEYYSLATLESLLARHSLDVFDVELNHVNGGSFRVYVRRCDGGVPSAESQRARVAALRSVENRTGLMRKDTYEAFAARVEAEKEKLLEVVHGEVAKGRRVYVYGASTKGNTLLQYYGLDHRVITAAAERNPDKWGKVTAGSWIPIVAEEEARRAKPEYFLVLPWHFMSEFRVREAEFLAGGGKFIVPLPRFHMYPSE